MSNRCPHDLDHALWPLRTPVQSRGCHRCEGVWLPGKVVADVLGTSTLPGLRDRPSTPLRCPDDAQPLHAVHHSSVEIDVCPSCHGVWLDRGELAAILAARPGIAEEAESALDEVDVDVDEVIEALFDRAEGRSGDMGQNQTSHIIDAAAPSAVDAGSASALDFSTLEVERSVDAVEFALPTEVVEGEGLLDGVGDAIGGVFEFIGDAFSGL